MVVKMFRPDSINDFENERDVLSRIRNSRSGHVNVLVNYGSLVYGEHRMLLLPSTDLGTLDDFIKDEKHRDTTAKKRNIIYCVIDVADALAWLTTLKISLPQKFREVQVMHCDIKPQNILIFPDSNREGEFIFKVSDFGHAFMSLSIETQSRRYESTYCAPETREKGIIEKTSDVWPYGCILLLVLIFTTRGYQEILDLRRDLQTSAIDTFYEPTNYQLKGPVSEWINILRDGRLPNADINETEMTKAMGKILHDYVLVSDHKSRKTMNEICGYLKEAYNKLYTAVQTSSLSDHKGILRGCDSCVIPARAEYVCFHDEEMNSYGIFFTDTLHFRGRLDLVMPMSPRGGKNWEKQFTLNVSTCASSHICLVKKAPPRMEQANLEVRQNSNQRLANEKWRITKVFRSSSMKCKETRTQPPVTKYLRSHGPSIIIRLYWQSHQMDIG